MKDAIYFLISTLLELLVLAFVLRLLLQTVQANFYNPISQAILRITNPLVIPARRAIPAWGRFDLPALVVIIALQLAATLTLLGLQGVLYGVPFPGVTKLLFFALLGLMRLLVQFYFFAFLVYALMSWFGPQQHNPLADILGRLCNPLLGPVRRLLPPIGGLDFSVLVVLLALQATMIALR
ncbi:MAG: YggT family protein [Gammaproteobacteria bacterium]|nr:YggT family protein [Gammaproteobacteria bacterium]